MLAVLLAIFVECYMGLVGVLSFPMVIGTPAGGKLTTRHIAELLCARPVFHAGTSVLRLECGGVLKLL